MCHLLTDPSWLNMPGKKTIQQTTNNTTLNYSGYATVDLMQGTMLETALFLFLSLFLSLSLSLSFSFFLSLFLSFFVSLCLSLSFSLSLSLKQCNVLIPPARLRRVYNFADRHPT